MPKHGKNFRNASKDLKPLDRFSVEDAVAKTVAASFAKFDETVDVAMRLGVDPKYSDQMVRGAVPLPNGLGKTVRVAVFCKGEKQAEAREAGADFVGAEDLIDKIKEGWLDFDAAIATPDAMDVAKAVKELKAGRVEFKVDKAGVLHAPFGKVSFGAEKLCGNLKALVEAVIRQKPAAAKGNYLLSMAVSSTMGPGYKIDLTQVKKFLEG